MRPSLHRYGRQSLVLTTLRNRYSVSLKGANLQQLMQLANQLGLKPHALKLDLADLKKSAHTLYFTLGDEPLCGAKKYIAMALLFFPGRCDQVYDIKKSGRLCIRDISLGKCSVASLNSNRSFYAVFQP